MGIQGPQRRARRNQAGKIKTKRSDRENCAVCAKNKKKHRKKSLILLSKRQTGIEVLRQKSKSIRGQTERTRRHLRNDYRLTDGQKTSRNIDPMRLQQICFGYSRLACSPSMLHIQDRQSNQRAAKRLSEPCNIYRRAGYNGVFEPHLGSIV